MKFVGQHFWAGGCLVSTVGRDETVIRGYIGRQEAEGNWLDQDQPLALSAAGTVPPTSGAALPTSTSRFERLTI